MAQLKDALIDEGKRREVVRDCVDIVDREVEDKSGFSGMAIKAGYKAVKGIKPGFVTNVVNDLLPEFADALDPIYQEARAKSADPGAYLADNADRAAEALLAITDRKAEKSQKGIVKSTYSRLRPTAKQNVAAAMPRLGGLLKKYAP